MKLFYYDSDSRQNMIKRIDKIEFDKILIWHLKKIWGSNYVLIISTNELFESWNLLYTLFVRWGQKGMITTVLVNDWHAVFKLHVSCWRG